ncbi:MULTISPECIES: ABC transporter ATP-binding protein [Halocynthiibacter]|uniref:ABC transporter ATP-binding protein n=1 Tax=Halocynthiibacter halioticoli TaxID=2986804 RepID=A0AAE3IWB0_9RHOB|nr:MULTISPECIES: ABC transporter ATP-binding protein [Halocynthiibacter]MCV6823387.1 ABC transporter ATP-binding protein [Halocynthiibacter halioticoli]MCW4056388.1 ABC transporter ATP-binding protein [Halocynthiibacter sp. SDUM655004]
MVENAIEISGLKKTYAAHGNQPPKTALKGIDLAIPKGSIFGLLGPNGAGKSTLINILAGLVTKTEGQINICGFDQDTNPRHSRASIGVMPQELNVDPFFSPREALEVQAGLYGIPKSKRTSDEILAMIGLTDKADAYARTLSGGMRRRLLLGKALVHHPDVLVLDEPTAGVDIEIRQMLWDNVRKLNEQGVTIILTTHYLEEAEDMCDEIAIINHGEVIVQDKTPALLGRLDRKTLVITPETEVTGLAAPAGTELEKRADGSLAFTYSSGTTSANSIFGALSRENVTIKDVRSEEPDLEEVFVSLTSSKSGS